MKMIIACLAVLAAFGFLAGCNTVNGLGKDVQAVGRGVSQASVYVERQVFAPAKSPQAGSGVAERSATVRAGEACDPSGELAGGRGLPPCPDRSGR